MINISHLYPFKILYNILFSKVGKIIIFLLLLFFTFFISCKNSILDSTHDDVNTVTDVSSVMVVDAENGGTLSLPNSVGKGWLEIPPGAVDQETTIKISTLNEATSEVIHLSLEPEGLTFNKPVRLTMYYEPEDDGSPPLISLIHISELNDVVDIGHELHNWAPLENIVLDEQTNSISGEIQHFSDIYIDEDNRLAYLILDLPGKHLRPGDGLFVLSGEKTSDLNGDWYPGHVGMVRSIDRDLDKLVVIESTPHGGPTANISGVQTNPFLLFKRSGHTYMGARRPKGKIMSEGERITAIGFGDQQKSKPYNGIGTSSFTSLPGWSCTGLLEGCWDEANRGSQGITDVIPMPSELFELTVPIMEISVKVSEEVKIPVYPVVAELDAGFFNISQDHYKVGRDVSEVVSVSGQPDKAEWKKDLTHPYLAQTLTWKPEPKDAGTTDTIYFQVSGSRSYGVWTKNFNITQELIIHVRGGHKYLSIYPAARGTSGSLHAYALHTPQGAVISPSSEDHLIDIATGKFPENPVFENQILENYSEGWYNEVTYPGYWGPKFHIKRLDFPYTNTPPGIRSWLYWFDYEVPWYNGLN
ncbi:MAG: hypothetical protein L3J11_01810 [Draconibacterium sp.]|nr:hypothetical protein [Draconibacterium sp.]